MSYTSTYLNFATQTEEAFEFYRSIFGGEFELPIGRFRDIPPSPDMPSLDEATGNMIMHICLPILGGHKLMGTDAPPSMGFTVNTWNNVYISLHPDTLEEGKNLYAKLSEWGTIEQPFEKMFWWAYFATWKDKYGVQWMVNVEEK